MKLISFTKIDQEGEEFPPQKSFQNTCWEFGISIFSGKLNAIVEYKVSKLRFENDSKEPKKKV